MLTVCPSCSTVFRVSAEQLKARAGRVRCGHCQQQFDALENLYDEAGIRPPPLAEDHAPDVSMAAAEPVAETAAADLTAHESATPETAEYLGTADEPPPLVEDTRTSIAEFMLGKTEPVVAAPLDDGTRPEPAYDLSFDAIPQAYAKPRRWPWAIASLPVLLALVAQAALHYRVEIAVLQPQLKPALLRACRIAGCEISLPQKAEFLGIETSDLHPDPEQKGHLLLATTLKNRAPFAQEYPLLEVTLNDVADHPLIIRDFKPGEYLPRDVSPGKGFGINAEVAVNLTLDVGDVPAAGYRLYLFYP